MEKTRKCGNCGKTGHNRRTCPYDSPKKGLDREIKPNIKARHTWKKCKAMKAFDNTLTTQGVSIVYNGRMVKSDHFKIPVKPEAKLSETIIEPLLDKWCKRYDGVEYTREPVYKTGTGRRRVMDYLMTISTEEGQEDILLEVKPPNRVHKGMEQMEDFFHEVPNVSHLTGVVTDGYTWALYESSENESGTRTWTVATMDKPLRVEHLFFSWSDILWTRFSGPLIIIMMMAAISYNIVYHGWFGYF